MIYYDKIILGAGIYGLYSALRCIEKGEKVLVLEYENAPFLRASWINQARIHNGYHYPRSYSTAITSAYYFERFIEDFEFAISKKFKKIYAISKCFSYTNAFQFKKFCMAMNVPCESIPTDLYFKKNTCEGGYETLEYTFDAKLIAAHLYEKLKKFSNFSIEFNVRINDIAMDSENYIIQTRAGQEYYCPFLINVTYASLNQVLYQCGLETFPIKYELCEVVLCKVSKNMKDIGVTVMDGPFFSLMPFGKTEYHSLTAVDYTPHHTSKDILPTFSCQKDDTSCTPLSLANCNYCKNRPKSNFVSMCKLAKKYLHDDISIEYHDSLFAMKAVLRHSELNDSRPTLIKFLNNVPRFLSIFSGKINTLYELDEIF